MVVATRDWLMMTDLQLKASTMKIQSRLANISEAPMTTPLRKRSF